MTNMKIQKVGDQSQYLS